MNITELSNSNTVGPATGDKQEIILSAKGVSKKFCKDMRRSMAYGIGELALNMVGVSPRLETLRKHEFWAVDDIDFELRKGEVLGLIGPNGCGKSTLLKVLANIYGVDSGKISWNCRQVSLLALALGFDAELSGRDNGIISGMVLGARKKEVLEKLSKISSLYF